MRIYRRRIPKGKITSREDSRVRAMEEIIQGEPIGPTTTTTTTSQTSNLTMKDSDVVFIQVDSDKSITLKDPDGVDHNSVDGVLSFTYYGSEGPCQLNIENGITTIMLYDTNAGVSSSFSGEFVIPNSITNISESCFDSCDGLTSIIIPDGVTTIGDYAICYCSSLLEIIIPDSVTSIGGGCFDSCDSLSSIIIPDSITIIESNTFSNCISLETIIIPDSVTSIGDGAFIGCSSLLELIIPDSVTSISNNSFRNCGLIEITLGNSVASIGSTSFSGCSNLIKYNIYSSVAPMLGVGVFGNYGSTLHLKTTGTSGYDVEPWTNTNIFSSIVYDL